MCRNIRPLYNYDPPSTDEDMYQAALQFVRKISGFTHPSQVNEKVFFESVINISAEITRLCDRLETKAPPRNRAAELARARERNRRRFGGVE